MRCCPSWLLSFSPGPSTGSMSTSREASVLGLAGAGGIGAPLIFAMNQYAWNQVSTLALGMILLAWLVDQLSAACHRTE